MVHRAAINNARLFYETYVKPMGKVTVVEIGSQNVNGSIRGSFGPELNYVGVDFAEGKDVDIVLTDPYCLPLPDGETDVVVTSSCFEHSEFFWLTFLEMVRIVRPGGLIWLNAPSNGPVHGYPVDCWRFYPDSGRALANWAVRMKHDVVMLESYTSDQDGGYLNDFSAIFLKGPADREAFPNRIINSLPRFTNGYVLGEDKARNPQQLTEDQRIIKAVQNYMKDKLAPI